MRELKKSQPYGPDFFVVKIECSNHILRNYLRRLRDLCKKARNSAGPVPLPPRKALQERLMRLRTAVTSAVKYRSNQNLASQIKIDELKKDILNGPAHVFGDHTRCPDRAYFCKGPKDDEENMVPNLVHVGLWSDIVAANNLVAHHASSLIENCSTNKAESFNSVVCKFVAGKRVNFSLRGGYTARCELSVIDVNTKGSTQRELHKHLTENSPGLYCAQYIHRRQSSAEKRRKRRTENKIQPKRKRLVFSDRDSHYGAISDTPDIDTKEFEARKNTLLQSLHLSDDEIHALQRDTVSQANSLKWREERRKRLTASSFGKICKLRKSTDRSKTVISLLYNEFVGNKQTRYGIQNEPIAIKQMEKELNVCVQACGLFVDKNLPYLGATPDGLIGDDAIVEVKCPAVAENLPPLTAIELKKITCCTIQNNCTNLKKTHNYMFQIQGQLHITNRKMCYFVIWTPKGILVEKIARDDTFWEEKMEHQLNSFYMNYVVPELIDPRYPRNLPIRGSCEQETDANVTSTGSG